MVESAKRGRASSIGEDIAAELHWNVTFGGEVVVAEERLDIEDPDAFSTRLYAPSKQRCLLLAVGGPLNDPNKYIAGLLCLSRSLRPAKTE